MSLLELADEEHKKGNYDKAFSLLGQYLNFLYDDSR